MSGRGRGRKRAAPTERVQAKRSKGAEDRLTDPDKGIHANAIRTQVVDFEQLIRESNILPPGCGGAENSVVIPPANNVSLQNLDSELLPLPEADSSSNLQEPLPGTSQGPQIMRVAADDLAAHVPQSLRQQIGRGEYVNIALLLKGSVELADFCGGSLLHISTDGRIESRPKQCKDTIKTIESWSDAFLIFSSIYLSTHTDKAQEMLHYMWTIRECAARQGGFAWRTYDEQFRLRQAITPASWAHINNDLWWRCLLVKESPNANNRSQRLSETMNTCVFYNKSKCFWHNCKFRHACSSCGLPHPVFKCTANRSDGQGSADASSGYATSGITSQLGSRGVVAPSNNSGAHSFNMKDSAQPFRQPFRPRGRGRGQNGGYYNQHQTRSATNQS